MIPLNVMRGTRPFTNPNWMKLAVEIAKKIKPYMFEPVLWPKTNCENEGAKLKVAPIQAFAKNTYIKNSPFNWRVNLIVENTRIYIATAVKITVLYPVLEKYKLHKNLNKKYDT
jgi:hypothetical protein